MCSMCIRHVQPISSQRCFQVLTELAIKTPGIVPHMRISITILLRIQILSGYGKSYTRVKTDKPNLAGFLSRILIGGGGVVGLKVEARQLQGWVREGDPAQSANAEVYLE